MIKTVPKPLCAPFTSAAAGDGFLLHIPPQAHTLAGFRRWALAHDFPEKVPVTFLQGEVFLDMSKEEVRSHSLVKTEVGRGLANLNREIDFGYIHVNGVLVTNVAAEIANNPDLVAVSWASLGSGRVRYVQKKDREVEIEGSPDLVLEIVSDSSVLKDTRHLRQAYHRAGIREYWLIDARGADIVFQVLHWRQKAYVAAPTRAGWVASLVFGRSFQLYRQRDRRGSWQYTLAWK